MHTIRHTVQTVIFDLGRVLVALDFSGEKFARLMGRAGLSGEEAFERFWNLDEVRLHMTGGIDSREFHRRVCARFGVEISYEEFAGGWCDIFRPMPGMRELFGEVAARCGVGLLSDTDPLHWRAICGLFPWIGEIGAATLSFEAGYLKPDPAVFGAAAAKCGSAGEACLFIDDRAENVEGARRFGMQAVRFESSEKLRRDLVALRILE